MTALGHCCYAQVFSRCSGWGLLSSGGWCLGFSMPLQPPLLQSTDSSSCGTQAWLPRSLWDLPGPRWILKHWTTRETRERKFSIITALNNTATFIFFSKSLKGFHVCFLTESLHPDRKVGRFFLDPVYPCGT